MQRSNKKITGEHRHGCYNRAPFKNTVMVQDGYESGRTPKGAIRIPHMVEIPDPMSRDCKYDMRDTDPSCMGCKWVDSTKEVK